MEATIETESALTPMAREIQSTAERSLQEPSAGEQAEKSFNESFAHRANGEPKPEQPAPGSDSLPETKGMSETASSKFKRIHERATAAEARAKQLESELAKRTGAPGNVTEFERLKKEHQEFDAQLKQAALERHPKFRAAYDGEIAKQITAAKAIVGERYAKDIGAILESADDEKWQQLSRDLGTFTTSQLAVVAASVQKLKADKAAELENWQANTAQLERFEAQQREAAKEAEIAKLNKAVEGAIEKAQRDSELYRLSPDNDEWNTEVASRINEVRRLATSALAPEDRASLALRAAGAEKYKALFLGTLKLANEYKRQAERYRSVNPNIGGASEPASQGISGDLSYIDAATQRLTDLGALRTS